MLIDLKILKILEGTYAGYIAEFHDANFPHAHLNYFAAVPCKIEQKNKCQLSITVIIIKLNYKVKHGPLPSLINTRELQTPTDYGKLSYNQPFMQKAVIKLCTKTLNFNLGLLRRKKVEVGFFPFWKCLLERSATWSLEKPL